MTSIAVYCYPYLYKNYRSRYNGAILGKIFLGGGCMSELSTEWVTGNSFHQAPKVTDNS